MQQFFNAFSQNFSLLTNTPSGKDQNLDPTSPTDDFCDPFLVDLPWSNQTYNNNEKNVARYNRADKSVGMNERNKDDEIDKSLTENEQEDHEKSESSNIETNGYEEIENANIENQSLDADLDTVVHAHTAAYDAFLANHREKENSSISNDDNESVGLADIIPDAAPEELEQETGVDELPEYPTIKELESATDLSLALKLGPMPRFCTFCFRWEDQPDDVYEEKDMVRDKCFMIGNKVFFRKRKPFWTECDACGFGLPRKIVRGRRISRVKKFLCKLTGREYTGYKFNQPGYAWMKKGIKRNGECPDTYERY